MTVIVRPKLLFRWGLNMDDEFTSFISAKILKGFQNGTRSWRNVYPRPHTMTRPLVHRPQVQLRRILRWLQFTFLQQLIDLDGRMLPVSEPTPFQTAIVFSFNWFLLLLNEHSQFHWTLSKHTPQTGSKMQHLMQLKIYYQQKVFHMWFLNCYWLHW